MEKDKYKILSAINKKQYNNIFPKSTTLCFASFRTITRPILIQNKF